MKGGKWGKRKECNEGMNEGWGKGAHCKHPSLKGEARTMCGCRRKELAGERVAAEEG